MENEVNKTEEVQINPDGKAFNGNYTAVGLAFGLIALGVILLVASIFV